MKSLLLQLQQLGVHYLTNKDLIMLEILENLDNSKELDMILDDLLRQLPKSNFKKLLLECPNSLYNRLIRSKAKLKITGERAVYTLPLLTEENISVPYYEIWQLEEEKSISLLTEIMQTSLNDTKKFIKQIREELPSQAHMMFTVYFRNNKPVGVVLPHIEPNTNNEGRIFWIGIHPNFKRQGLGKNLHKIGLHRLKTDFHAKVYLGITNIENHAMRNIMIANGCKQSENTLISLESLNSQ